MLCPRRALLSPFTRRRQLCVRLHEKHGIHRPPRMHLAAAAAVAPVATAAVAPAAVAVAAAAGDASLHHHRPGMELAHGLKGVFGFNGFNLLKE